MADNEFYDKLDDLIIERVRQQAYDLKHMDHIDWCIKYNKAQRKFFNNIQLIFLDFYKDGK